MMKLFRFSLLVVALLMINAEPHAQIIIDNTVDEVEAVEEILLGSGVEAFNIEFFGDQNQIGSFNSNGSNLSLSEGVILATGSVNVASSSTFDDQDVSGPGGNAGGGSSLGGGNFGAGDMDLAVLSGQQLNDAAILEFDFIPQGDSLKFEFIFASEEYNEFVGDVYNDAFGFFLSGPNINGTFSENAVNLALVPGTNTAITINSVNLGVNAEYFVNNEDTNTDSAVIEYDGFTFSLLAEAQVECGELYHIKMVIADGFDTGYDSAVFLQASSFSSNQFELDLVQDLGFTANDSTLYESCGEPIIRFTRPQAQSEEQTITLEIGGTADAGVDFETIPTEIMFDENQSVYELPLTVFSDGLDESIETIVISLENQTPCSGGSSGAEFTIYITDVPELIVELADGTSECGSSVLLEPNVSGGVGEYTYLWEDASTELNRLVSPGITTSYTITVTDECFSEPVSATATITVPETTPVEVDLGPDQELQCLGTVLLVPEVTGGTDLSPDLTYNWFSEGELVSTAPEYEFEVDGSQSITLVVTDFCGQVGQDEVNILVTVEPITIDITPSTSICPLDSTLIEIDVTGGLGELSVNWLNQNLSGSSFYVSPLSETIYTVQVTDECGSAALAETTVNLEDIQASFTAEFLNSQTAEFMNTTNIPASVEWNFNDEAFSFEQNPTYSFDVPFEEYVVSLYVTSENGCVDSTFQVFPPSIQIYVPNAFTPDNDGLNEVFKVATNSNVNEFKLVIFERGGTVVYESFDINEHWDGSVNGGDHYAQPDVYNYILVFRGDNTEIISTKGSITLIR